MRIGFDAKRLFNNFTGLGNYSRFVLKALLEHYPNHSYTLYSPKVKEHQDTHEFRSNPKLLVRTPPKWVRGSGFGSFWRSVNLGNIAFRDGMDLLHGLSNELPVTKPQGLKTVVTIHDLIFLRYPELYSSIDVKIYKKKIIHACKTADKIIAISEQTSRDLQEYLDVPARNIKVIYQGAHSIFAEKHNETSINEVKRKYQLPKNYILSVGTIETRKNALLILEALVRLNPNIAVVLVGKATSYQAQLESFINSNGLKGRVYFIHKVEFIDLPKVYQGAHVFVYPSRFEGFGIPIVEAIQSKIPVVAATGSCLEEAGGPFSRYVDPNDSGGLANQLTEILENDSLRQEMIDKSLQYIQQFEPKHIADEMVKVYTEVLN